MKRQVDLSNEQATTAAVLDVFPQAIVNCAAISVPEQCDLHPALAQAMNVELPTTPGRDTMACMDAAARGETQGQRDGLHGGQGAQPEPAGPAAGSPY